MYRTIDELWFAIVQELLEKGDRVESRIGSTRELLGYSATLSHVQQTFLLNKRRKLSPAYACAEFLWYLTTTRNIEMIKAYAPQYVNFAEDGVAHGAYGYRIENNTRENQLELLIEHLRQSPGSRQAVVTFWKANDLWHSVRDKRKDLPCTLSLQFLIRKNKLHLVTTMRSNDAWLGLPYDVFAFTCFQWLIASVLGVEPGTYTHQAGSMHLYEKNWVAAREAVPLSNNMVDSFHVCPSKYQRLEHDWDYSVPENWQYEINRAIWREREIREGDTAGLLPLNDILYDAVACCATKWNGKIRPKSPVLLEALKNAKK